MESLPQPTSPILDEAGILDRSKLDGFAFPTLNVEKKNQL